MLVCQNRGQFCGVKMGEYHKAHQPDPLFSLVNYCGTCSYLGNWCLVFVDSTSSSLDPQKAHPFRILGCATYDTQRNRIFDKTETRALPFAGQLWVLKGTPLLVSPKRHIQDDWRRVPQAMGSDLQGIWFCRNRNPLDSEESGSLEPIGGKLNAGFCNGEPRI